MNEVMYECVLSMCGYVKDFFTYMYTSLNEVCHDILAISDVLKGLLNCALN